MLCKNDQCDKDLAQAFKDLENDICKIKNMSVLVETIMEECIGRSEPEEGFNKFLLSEDQWHGFDFAIRHLCDMIRKFRDDYYARLEGKETANG